ncbi:hypothetical protein OG892_00780 [Streptomyces sp. NBC_00341]|uniref:hypothetical protein n=1 Tax=unclassified Streptomyces TaxID=2593676 RepID=UPI00093ADBE6|nr:hypothetical protein [Streptomyces sp. CB02488]WRZ09342.1 hypothetical protein OG892_00315 [Streptomyces sp. NBC_00341]WRZ09419.1 hypothetical protein OG892_00780 [Streptomyces sp. NBC_00341]
MTRPTEDEESRLRRAFSLIGEAVAVPESAEEFGQGEAPRKRASSRPTRKRGRTVLWTAAAACAAVLVIGVAVAASGGSSAPSAGGTTRGQTFPELLACSNSIVEGTLKDVRAVSNGRVRVTMSVDRWLKPENGLDTATFALADPTVRDPEEAYGRGDHVLMVIPSNHDQIATTFPLQGQEIPATRDRIIRALPGVTAADCPTAFR